MAAPHSGDLELGEKGPTSMAYNDKGGQTETQVVMGGLEGDSHGTVHRGLKARHLQVRFSLFPLSSPPFDALSQRHTTTRHPPGTDMLSHTIDDRAWWNYWNWCVEKARFLFSRWRN